MLNAKNGDGGWGYGLGDTSDPLDTALALQALKAANYTDTVLIGQSLTYLTTNQNSDGGWGFQAANGALPADESNNYVTAIVLKTLAKYRSQYDLQSSMDKASSYLLTKQNTDGGFGSSPSTVYDTALSFTALTESGKINATAMQNAQGYLASTQLADGSWNDDPYSTALALQALASVQPNLTLSGISFSKLLPMEGENVVITANVANTGLEDTSNVVVRFYLGDPAMGGAQMGSDQVIAALPAGSSAQASVTFSFTGNGAKTIYAVADPDNLISETSEQDNKALAQLWVATFPDLAVYSEDLKPSTPVPAAGTAFTLEYTIRNLGESAADGFDVSVYDGDTSGTPLQTAHISGIAGTEVRTGTLGITLSSDGAHTLTVVADSGNVITESSEDNNIGSVTVNVGGTLSQADLSISPVDIALVPSRPHAGDTVMIAARVKNLGADIADNFTIEFFDGNPDSGGATIYAQTLTLDAGGEQSVTTGWVMPEGIHDVYVVLDRANQIIESNETNNKASVRIMADMVDLEVSATDLVLNPAHPVSGDAVALSIAVHNTGIRGTGAFNVALYDGDPAAGGVLLQTYPVDNLAGDGSASFTYTFAAQPHVYRFYVVADPENQVDEMYENNNTAIRSLTIKNPGEALGPDLVPVKLDLTDTTSDPQTLSISGTAHVTIQNKGDAKVTDAFDVIVFEDTDNDAKYTAGVDTLLGTGTNSMAIWPEGATSVNVELSGTVQFLHSPIYAFADSGDAILEQNEDNNILTSCKDCQVVPLNPIQPIVEWSKTDGSSFAGMPVIANLNGKNSDTSQPAILYVKPGDYYPARIVAKLYAVDGKTGNNLFIVTPSSDIMSWEAIPAVGDIDGDGLPEIIVPAGGKGLLAYSNTGILKWDDSAQVAAWNTAHFPYYASLNSSSAPVIADIDGDGKAEIIEGATVINNDGSIRWAGCDMFDATCGTGKNYFGSYFSIVADLDLDGKQEIIAGHTAFNADGTVKWNANLPDGMNAVGNFDDDPYPEIILVTAQLPYRMYLLEHDGTIKWGPVPLDDLWSPPVVADFDGDGETEIGVRTKNNYIIFDKNGNYKKDLPLPFNSSIPWGAVHSAPAVFDLNGDGRPEVLFSTDYYFRIFDGKDGTLLYQESYQSTNPYLGVMIADVDNDGQAEAVLPGVGNQPIRIYGAKNHDWVNARPIMNQFSYHVTNVNDDGSIPQYESPSWLLNNTYRAQAPIGPNPNPYLTPNLTASYMRAEQTGASVDLAVRIGNGGAIVSSPSVTITFYDNDPANGGVVIGTSSTTRALNPGDYQDVTFSWTGGEAGRHQVYAVVDAANVVPECREDDNQASVDVTIEAGSTDLKIGSEDITLPPAPYYEGSVIPVTANVRNLGTLPASNVTVKLYNGSPSTGGARIGSTQTLSNIAGSGTGTVLFSFDTLGKAGTNVLYVVVDEENSIVESNETNNTALVSLDVQAPVLPDLAVTADNIQLSPALASEGQAVTITATITNRGAAASNIPVRISLGDPGAGGIVISDQTIYPVLGLGQTAAVFATLDTAGLAGAQTIFVTIDPLNTTSESNKTDDVASKGLFIQSSGLTFAVSLDKTSYQANETATATVALTNTTSQSRTLGLNLAVKDSAGNLIATIAQGDLVSIGTSTTLTLTKTWNTGATLAGAYSLTGEVAEGQNNAVISKASASFSITADKNVTAVLTTDKISYAPNQTAVLTSVVTNQSANSILENLTATLDIGASGTFYTETKAINTLMPGAAYTFKSYWNTETRSAGTYPMTLTVKDATGTVIATATQTLVISSTVDPTALLRGQVSMDRQVFLAGESANATYGITNIGNTDLTNVTLSVKTVSVDEKTVYDTYTTQASIGMGGTYTGAVAIDTTKYGARDYLVVLSATIGGTEETLAGTYLRIEGAPTAPSLNSPADGSDVLTFTPVLAVNNASDPNDDKISYEFVLYSDSGLTQAEAYSGQIAAVPGVTSWTMPFVLTENQTYYWRCRAFDGWLYGPWSDPASFRVNTVNDPPTAPVLSSPIDGGVVSTLTPLLTIDNASDPDSLNLTYNFDLALDPEFTRIVASESGVTAGPGMTSWQVPLSLTENVNYYWRAQADDWFIAGPWSTTSRFFVNTVNDAPSIPVVIAPANNAEIAALEADVTVQNSTDPDSYSITYTFEADTAQSFDSPDLVIFDSVPEGDGTTTWHVAGLKDNSFYYVRVKASDGQAESSWSAVTSFFANTANDPPSAPTLANPSNGGAVTSFTPALSVQDAADPDHDTLTYEFAVYADSGLNTLVASGNGVAETPGTTSWTVPSALTENSNYFWTARAFDGEAYGAWMPAATFMVNTANDAPGAPQISSPADGNSVTTKTPTLAIKNAVDPDSDNLTYTFEVYKNGTLVAQQTNIPQNSSGITSITLTTALSDDTVYQWRARAFDGGLYGPWTSLAAFTVHLPQTGIAATIDFDPDTLKLSSNGTWVVVYIELQSDHDVKDIDVGSIKLENSVPAELKPFAIGDHDRDGIPDLMVKFKRSTVESILPAGQQVTVHVKGKVGETTFEGVDVIRVMP